MNVVPIMTDPITPRDDDLLAVIDRHLPSLPEKSILAVASKIVAICEGRVIPVEAGPKSALIEGELAHRARGRSIRASDNACPLA